MTNSNRRHQRQARKISAEQSIPYQKALQQVEEFSKSQLPSARFDLSQEALAKMSVQDRLLLCLEEMVEQDAKALRLQPGKPPILVKHKAFAIANVLGSLELLDLLENQETSKLNQQKVVVKTIPHKDHVFVLTLAYEHSKLFALITKSYQKPIKVQDHLFVTIEEAKKKAERFYASARYLPMPFNQAIWPKGTLSGRLAMLQGKSNSGKTLLEINYVFEWAKQGHTCLFYSLESKRDYIQEGLVALERNISREQARELIDQGNLQSKILDLVTVVDAIGTDVEISAFQIQLDAQRLAAVKQKVDFIVIDHLNLLAPNPNTPSAILKNDKDTLKTITMSLFELCKQADVFVLVASQISREHAAGVKFPYDANPDICIWFDHILNVWRPEQQEGLNDQQREKLKGQMMLEMSKNRYGEKSLEKLLFSNGKIAKS